MATIPNWALGVGGTVVAAGAGFLAYRAWEAQAEAAELDDIRGSPDRASLAIALADQVAADLARNRSKYDRKLMKKFQAAAGIPESGLYDPLTRDTLLALGIPESRLPPPYAGGASGTPQTYLPTGRSGQSGTGPAKKTGTAGGGGGGTDSTGDWLKLGAAAAPLAGALAKAAGGLFEDDGTVDYDDIEELEERSAQSEAELDRAMKRFLAERESDKQDAVPEWERPDWGQDTVQGYQDLTAGASYSELQEMLASGLINRDQYDEGMAAYGEGPYAPHYDDEGGAWGSDWESDEWDDSVWDDDWGSEFVGEGADGGYDETDPFTDFGSYEADEAVAYG